MLIIVNLIPSIFVFKEIKCFLLLIIGVKLNIFKVFIKSNIAIDRPKNITIGRGVFINRNVYFEGSGKIAIGNSNQIGPNVTFATSSHDTSNNMQTIIGDIALKDNVWVGANSVILQNVVLGPNLVVGAGTIVTKSFKNCVVAGNPAQIIKHLKHPEN